MVQVGFCLERVYDTYLVLWKSRQKCKRTGDGENFYCVMKFQTDFKRHEVERFWNVDNFFM